MGTPGSVTVRWKNCYWVIHHRYHAYPSGLGVDILNSIPKDLDEYQEWLENLQKEVEDKVNDYLCNGETARVHSSNEEVRSTEPEPFGYDYEMDLDHEVFLYDKKPLFSLKSMPPEEEFKQIIGDFDHNPHYLLRSRVPEQYKHNWKATPPTVNPSDPKTYHSLIGPDAIIDDIAQLLSIPEHIARAEESRIATYESLICVYLQDGNMDYFFSRIDTIASSKDIPLDIISLGISIITHGLWPMIFDASSSPLYAASPSLSSLSKGYDWVVLGRCIVKVVTHLDDEMNLQAAIIEIVNLVQEEHITKKIQIDSQTVHGILFSFSHCVLVRAEFSSGMFTYTHTPALKFLPVEYPVDGSTPGITAVARLGHILYRYILDSWFSEPPIIAPKDNEKELAVLRVPTEIWRTIADQLHYYVDLAVCASFSEASKNATIDSLSFPRIDGATLYSSILHTTGEFKPALEQSIESERAEQERKNRNTYTSIFDVRIYGKGSAYKDFRERSRTPRPKEIKGRVYIDHGWSGLTLYRPLSVHKEHEMMKRGFKKVTDKVMKAVIFNLQVVCSEGIIPLEILCWQKTSRRSRSVLY
ncbi:hypothetical protein VKT23_011524 [Stygiomarasmius scandens]|uniref:Uncharacterized protein n=1 Tax=Marasmiellus scandens TaxID=2682957 RepID=A0ABR1JE22_9AGAR